jgi:hypothetical protein
MSKNDVKKYGDYVKEATETGTGAMDSNVNAMSASVVAYNKHKSKVTNMFNNVKSEDMEKLSTDFENFIKGLPENEKGASDMLRTLYSSEKIKVDIKNLETQKKSIEEQILSRMDELKKISNNLK